MITHLYANGDSWTHGDGIEDDPKFLLNEQSSKFEIMRSYTWPTCVANKLGITVTNEGMGGGSNERMVRMTCDYIQRYPKDQYNNLLVILGWTDVSRREYFIDDGVTGSWGRFNANQLVSTYEHHYDSFLLKNIDRWHNDYIKFIYSYKASCLHFFEQMYLMKNLLEHLGIKYLFFSSMNWRDDRQFKIENEIHHLVNVASPSILVTRDCEDFKNIMASFCRQHGLPLTKDKGHTMIDGHSAWANHLVSELQVIYNF